MPKLYKLAHKNWEVPAFSVTQLLPKQHEICVCVFVINEGKKIQKQLKQMSEYADQADIIIADGGSTDGSLDADTLKLGRVRSLLTKQGSGKLSAQMRMAFAYALEQGYTGVVVIDGNNKDDVTGITLFIEALGQGYDHLQGSRFIPGGQAINTPTERLIGLKLLHAPLISLAAGFRYTDTTNGFRAYSAKLLSDPKIHIFREVFVGYELHYYLAIQAAKRGYRIKEIPVTRTYPKGAPAPTKISPIRGNWLVLRTLFKAALGRYNYKQ